MKFKKKIIRLIPLFLECSSLKEPNFGVGEKKKKQSEVQFPEKLI